MFSPRTKKQRDRPRPHGRTGAIPRRFQALQTIRRAGALITGEWSAQVVEGPNIVGVFFTTNGDAGAATARDTLIRDFKAKYPRTSVGAFVAVDSSKAKSLWDAVSPNGAHSTADERPDLVFISAKKGSYTRFLGSLSVPNLGTFVHGALARGTGAKTFPGNALPQPW
jgi:hypothetical protein